MPSERLWNRTARVFGSTGRGEDEEGSDLDLLIEPTPETTLFDWRHPPRIAGVAWRASGRANTERLTGKIPRPGDR
jgi:predicted nucleotidyltransferase